jgi:hypothetical protein
MFRLPCIKSEDDFRRELKEKLLDLNPSSSYFIYFCLYLNTNDESKKLIPKLKSKPTHEDEDVVQYFAMQRALELSYLYSGYYIVHSYLLV